MRTYGRHAYTFDTAGHHAAVQPDRHLGMWARSRLPWHSAGLACPTCTRCSAAVTWAPEYWTPSSGTAGSPRLVAAISRSTGPAALGEQLLNFLGALPGTFAHRYPAEQFMQQAPLFQAVGQGAGRVQELQLDNRACRDDACGKMVRPRLSQLVLQDPEYAGGVDQIEDRAHWR